MTIKPRSNSLKIFPRTNQGAEKPNRGKDFVDASQVTASTASIPSHALIENLLSAIVTYCLWQ